MATLASLLVVMGMNTVGLTAGAAKVQGSLAGVGAAAKSMGSVVPLAAAAGGAAVLAFAADSVHAALDYDKAFARIGAISNASAKDIQVWRGEVMELGGRTAQAPKDLADALFFLSSAGIDSGEAMGVLEMSAKAAASGLGITTDVAKITTNAMNAYAASGLTAAQVTDTLVAAVREGSAEPDEFAGALGRILPIASQAGIEFDQVTASLAALSNIGLDVNEGVTAMRGLLTALFAPTVQTEEAMKKLGLSTEQVRASLTERGLIATLRMLEDRTGGNIDTMRALVPNVRALAGVFGLTAQEAEKVNDIFRKVRDSTGDASEAFEKMAETDSFRLEQAWNRLGIAGQRLAEKVIPVFADIIAGSEELALSGERLQARYTPNLNIFQRLFGMFQSDTPSVQALAAAHEVAAGAAEHMGRMQTFAAQQMGLLDQESAKIPKRILEVTGAIRDFAGMSGKALKEFRLDAVKSIDDAIGSLDSYERKWGLTAAAAVKAMEGMALKAGQMARDFRNLDKEAIPERLEAWLIQQGPAAVHAFVTGTESQQSRFAAAWKLYEKNTRDAVGAMERITRAGGIDAGAAMARGLIDGMKGWQSQVAATAAAIARSGVNAMRGALESQSPSRVTFRLGQDLIAGLAQGLLKDEDKLLAAIDKVMGAVQDKLSNMLSRSSSFGQSIRGGFSSLLDISGAMGPDVDIQGFFQTQLGTAQQFSSILKMLETQGAGTALLSAVAGQGPEAIPFAQQLLQSGPQGIAEVNKAYNDIAKIADKTGDVLSNRFFGDKIAGLKDVLVDIRDAKQEIHIHVNGSVVTERQLIDVIRDGLIEAGRSGKGHH